MVDDSAHGAKVAKGSPTFNDGPAAFAADAPRFTVPVDSENKSKVLKIWSFSRPHHLSFHLSWMSFMVRAGSVPPPLSLLCATAHLARS